MRVVKLVLAAFMLSCSACIPNQTHTKKVMIVEFDVFSGRPNPRWQLSDDQVIEIQEALQNLPSVDQTPGESGLGYRGFILSSEDVKRGITKTTRIYKGIVTVDDEHPHSCRDINNIEYLLLMQASQYGYKTIVDGILEEIRDR